AARPEARQYASYILQNYTGMPSSPWEDLVFDEPAAPAVFWDTLPLQHHAPGTGLTTGRADWSYHSTWWALQMGNLLPDAGHQRPSQGHLRIQRSMDDLLVSAVTVLGDLNSHANSRLANTVVLDDNGEGNQVYRFGPGVWYGSPGVVTRAYEAARDHVYV